MDPCHSLSPRSPASTSAVTVAHLIRNIEQLKNKDKLISQLEKDLGHQWVAAQLAALERGSSEGATGPAVGTPSHALGALPESSYDPDFTWTPTSTPTLGGVEEAWSTNVEGIIQPKKLRERNKELVDKCRAYLQRTKELTAQNRAYKDSSDKVLQENKKMQELLEHSKLRVLQLTRQLSEVNAEKINLERQTQSVAELKTELMEDKKQINALKQACSDKDRRIELIQHRKKRRRLLPPAEKNMGVKETFFGYDEDTKSVDSENSFSSLSHSTISDDDVWDEVMSREETERHYQRLMMEHLQLQKSHALLQRNSEPIQDPQREEMTKATLQNDLINAQCRIEKLEKLINEIGEGEVLTLLKERETICARNDEMMEQLELWQREGRRLQQELNESLEKSEDLEFQLMELEHADKQGQNASCDDSPSATTSPPSLDNELLEKITELGLLQQKAVEEMEQLRKDLAALLKGKGKEADALLKRLDSISQNEKKHAMSLESMAHELQMKVISLQKDKDSLNEKLSLRGHKPGKGDHSSSVAAREKLENLELKEEVAKLVSSESRLLDERIHLQEEVQDWKTQYEYLKQQLDILTHIKDQQQQIKAESAGYCSSGSSSPQSPSPTSLTRKNSKDRKSKPRSGDDPTETKRRKSSRDDDRQHVKKTRKSMDDKPGPDQHSFSQSFKNIEDIKTMTESVEEMEALKRKLKTIEVELYETKEDNYNLRDQLKQSVLEKSSEAEADQQLLLDRVESLQGEIDLLRSENMALAGKLKQRVEEFHDNQDEMNPRVAELEEYCEDLQERLHASEMTERQMKDKLKLTELSIDDAESSEMAMREKYEELLARETEAKKQTNELQRTVRELKDIVWDKDIMEQALRDKVDFLQKAEAASVSRIEELEAIEKDLREELERERSDPKGQCQRELHKIQELKHQITFLETDNKALSSRVAELEENEETLRENWRRVADEDYSRTQSLEEKVKMLETLNRDLRHKLTDAQEYLVVTTGPSSENSLAEELAESQMKSSPSSGTLVESGDDVDGQGEEGETPNELPDIEKKALKEKLRKLERKLSDVSEKKNTTIESLQEKIVSLKENEIKLSETISEMEMTEREIRAKLALYESSEVTVEKMLKYQSKIQELRTSQESLLDQIESMENQEMTMQEKMQEMERTLRGKIVTLEVEMKGFKQKELKNAAKIRELEKVEKELTEKVTVQAEKENGLYVKISSLMDELKASKEKVEKLNQQMADREDKVRKAKLLEVKLLEIEMEYGKKLSAVSSKLRHKEEELRQKEAAHKDQIDALQSELSDKDSEHSQEIADLETKFAQKEKDLNSTISSYQESIDKITQERDEYVAEVKQLMASQNELQEKDQGYEQEMDILRQEVSAIKASEKEYEEKVSDLEENVAKEKKRADEAESKVASLESELAKEKENVLAIETKIISLKGDIAEKMKNIETNLVEKESEYEKEMQSLQGELDIKDARVKELEKQLEVKENRVSELEAECDNLKSKAATVEKITKELEATVNERDERIASLEKGISEKDRETEEEMSSLRTESEQLKKEVSQLKSVVEEKDEEIKDVIERQQHQEKEYKQKLSSMKTEQEHLQSDLRNKVEFLNSQLTQEMASRETEKSSLQETERTLSSEMEDLREKVNKYQLELSEKQSELENKDEECRKLSLEVSNTRNTNESLQHDIDSLKDKVSDLEMKQKELISERDQTVRELNQNLASAESELQQLQVELSQKDSMIQEVSSSKERFIQEKQVEIEQLKEEKAQKEIIVQEHMQKSEQVQQQSKQEQQTKNTELEKLRRNLDEKDALVQEYQTEKREMELQIQDQVSQIQMLEQKLSDVTEELHNKKQEMEQVNTEVSLIKKDQETSLSQMEALQREIDAKHGEIEKKAMEHTESKSLVSVKQQELEHARNELQKCLLEIEDYKQSVQEKENNLHQQDQAYKQISADNEGLSLQCKEKDQTCKQLEFKVSDIELKLVEAENRYRELEAKCASLELQLEERFASAQEAEKVIKSKTEEYKQLESKLAIMEKEYKEASDQVQEAEQIIRSKDQEQKQLESKFQTLERDYVTLEKKIQSVNEKLKSTETQLLEANNECESLETQVKQSKNQMSESESEFVTLQSDLNSLKKKYKDRESELRENDHQLQELHVRCEENENTIQNLKSKLKDSEKLCSDMKIDIKKAENDYKEKCAQYKILEEKLQLGEQELENCEGRRDELKKELQSVEEKLHGSNQQVIELTSKISVIENALEEKELFCRDSQNGLSSLEQKHLDTQIECENLKSKLNYFQELLSSTQSDCEEKDEKLEEIETALHQTRTDLSQCQDRLSEKETSYKDVLSQLEHSQNSLFSSQEEVKNYANKLDSLEGKQRHSVTEIEDLKNDRNRLDKELEEKLGKCSELESEISHLKQRLADYEHEVSQTQTDYQLKLKDNEKHYSATLSELQAIRTEIDNSQKEHEKKCAELESQCKQLEKERDVKSLAVAELESSKANLLSSIQHMEQENETLKASLQVVENSLHSTASGHSELIKANQDLSQEISTLKNSFIDTENINLLLEKKVKELTIERDDAQSQVKHLETEKEQLVADNGMLQEELDDASKEFENLRNSFEESKSRIQSRMDEMSKSKEDVDKVMEKLKGGKEEAEANIEEYKKMLDADKERCEQLLEENENLSKRLLEIEEIKSHLEAQNTTLEVKLSQKENELIILKGRISDLQTELSQSEASVLDVGKQAEVVDESEIHVSLAPHLKSAPRKTDEREHSDNNVLQEKLSSLESHHDETVVKMEALMGEIAAYKTADIANQEKLQHLEKTLKEMKDREKKLTGRVKECEDKEKELLEQMADIEANVIVPLENENQELKDEISVVKQERDDAQARASHWGEDDEDQLDVESVHKSLEDALVKRDELEKKVDILSEEITQLESEKTHLIQKCSDYEASQADLLEKVESLEEENERLQGLERRTSVVEEAETRLMDRVLDLEEKEQQLTSELVELRNKKGGASSVETKEKMSYKDMLEKLKYLEQKNEVLQDAEGRYMDKIMDLEETQHRLQSELSSLKSSPSSTYFNMPEKSETSKEPVVSSGSDSVDQTDSVPSGHFVTSTVIQLTSAQKQPTAETNQQQPSEQTLNTSGSNLDFVRELEIKNHNLVQECEDKAKQIKYLEEKLELLHDSEAKLMEKLLETEENAGHKSDTEEDNDLKEKIEQLTEENEFLAQSIENYKQLYKEEKEKNNELHDRVLEDSSLVHELHEANAELKSTQVMVEDIQSEYEEQLSEREQQLAQVNKLLFESQQREKTLESQWNDLKQQEEDLQRKLDAFSQRSDSSAVQAQKEEEIKHQIEALNKRELELKDQIKSFQQREKEYETSQQQLETKLQTEISESRQLKEAMQQKLESAAQHEQGLQEQVNALRQKEQDLLQVVAVLERQVQEMSQRADADRNMEEESAQSDSGLSADDQRARYDNRDKGSPKSSASDPSEVQETFRSKATLTLAQPSQKPSTNFGNLPTSSHGENQTPPLKPVAPPRSHRGKSRQPSIDSISQEELVFLVEELQNKEAALKRRIQDLEAVSDSDLSHRVEELELKNQNLERKLRYHEQKRSSEGPPPFVKDSKSPYFYQGGDSNNNSNNTNSTDRADLNDSRELDSSFSSVLSSSSTHTMLDKPEDVLHQRIRELEGLDKHHKNQLSELERDREVLHEIARKDKATIHDLNVKIRELQLSERSLKEQVNSLEISENSLYSKCEDLEATKAKLEDRVHELEIHERRLRELVRRLKLDEEHWLSKSGGMETAVAELSANEQQLKRLLQDIEMEKGGLSERADYLEARIRELENSEAALIQRVKSYETNHVSLQNRLVHLENSEAAAHSKASELDVMNMDLSQRLQKAVEENAMLAQHVSQMHGQIQELDRRLLSARDSELAYKQHVESLQKNESSLQKKVREYELREIDSQAKVRELEQTNEILNDKMATLQRSENRLKYRVQELEGVGGQIPGELTPAQKQKVPQKLEDCQKRVVVLQSQVETLQLQLRDALNKNAQSKLASQSNESDEIAVPKEEYSQLQTKSALLEETLYQMEEVEGVNVQLNETILQLRQGKGASGHEVEIEVLKRRLASYKTFINKLKSSLSTGQATSLWDPEQDSGLQGETLPARHLHGLESERVLQSVRGLQDGKAETSSKGGAQQYGLTSEEDSIVQSKATSLASSRQPSAEFGDDDGNAKKPEQASSREESHWRAIEARKPKAVAGSRGGAFATLGTGAKKAPPTQQNGSKRSSTPEVEEVTIGLHLQSESELSSHHRTNQNDTDSSASPVPPPRRGRANRAGKSSSKTYNVNNHSGTESSDGLSTDENPASSTVAANIKLFGDNKSLPSQANSNITQQQQTQRAPLTRFGEDSFYLPSSTQEGVDSLDDDEAPPLPSSGPPGMEKSPQLSSAGSAENLQPDRKDSMDESTSGMSIRERIAMIERQLQSDGPQSKESEDQVFYWKRKATDSMKQVELLEKDNKHMKDDINRLEKELEEKRRYIDLLELWLSNLEDLLKNKNKQTDREMVEQLQLDLTKLRSDLKKAGYRSEDAVLDGAALKTELEHRDKEIVSRRNEISVLTHELKRSQDECRNIEGMRRTALDSLRALEHEVIDLQQTEKQLKKAQAELQTLKAQTEKTREVYEENISLRERVHQSEVELIRLRNVCDDYNNLSARYDELDTYKNQALNMIQPLQAKLERLARKCQEKDALLRRLGAELQRGHYRPSSALDDLTRMQSGMNMEEYNTDFPHLSNGPQRPERRKSHARSSSMEELDMVYPYSDSDSGSIPASSSKRKRPTHYVNNRPKSAETLSSGSRVQREAHAHSRSVPGAMLHEGQKQGMGSGVTRGQFVAIADYDPALFSQSGRPRLELELREGDHVFVTGPMDRTGYYEAEVNGRTGLVPANYLQPLKGSGHMTGYGNHIFGSGTRLDHGPGQMGETHRQKQQHNAFTRPTEGVQHRIERNGQFQNERQPERKHSLVPDPPHNLHVKGIVNDRSILLSWLPPKLDSKGNNKGVKVLGYMVYLNNQEYEQIPSPNMCEVVVEGLNPDHPQQLAVQSLCAGGYASPRAELVFEGIVKMGQGHSVNNRGEDQEDLDTDLSSVLNSAHYKRGHRKTVMALYDYNPEVQSPHDYTSFELAFQAGDVIHVYGEQRPDGFFHGEIHDKRGLVPACFVEDVSKMTRHTKKPGAETEQPSTTA